MQPMDIRTTDFYGFYQATEVFQASSYINTNKEVNALEDIPRKSLAQKLPPESCRSRWRINGGEHHLEYLEKQYKRLRRGPSETLMLFDDQF